MEGKTSQKVFTVHGQDEAAKNAVARFIAKLGLEAIILDEQPSEGLTIIEKFEKHAKGADFAIVLMTPDDVGAPIEKKMECETLSRIPIRLSSQNLI